MRLPVFLLTTLGSCLCHAVAAEDANAFFEKRIRPLLVEKCYSCHSPEHKVKGGLRLDTREGWTVGGDSGPSVIPHEPEKSLLLKAVTYQDRDLKMPPKEKLSASDVAAIREWIALGAPDPRTEHVTEAVPVAVPKKGPMTFAAGREFWSFKLPVMTPPAPVKDASWPRTDTDRFILGRLEEKGLQPAPDASATVLVRRVYHDLIGLPPSPEEIARFIVQPDVAALVDRLMATPQFGERWGRHWLDLARFAESSGGGRTLPFKDAWRFRDYVIESLNADVPLDRFITEQVAGDLLPHATAEERRRHLVATGFLVLGPTNYEEQDKGMLRMDIVDEQLETLGRGLLGMTISCARCHDHKFDPIPASDYYALAGILRSTRTLKNYKDNVAHWIDSPLPLDGEKETAMQAQETRMVSLEADIAKAKKELKKIQPKPTKLASGTPVEVEDLPGIVVDDVQAKKIGPWKSSTRYPSYIGEGYLHDGDGSKGSCTITFAPAIPKAGRYEVRLAYMTLVDRCKKVPVTILHADGEETVFVDQTEAPTIDNRFVSLGQYRFEKDGAGFVLLSNEGTDGFVTADAVVFVPVEELNEAGTKQKKDAPVDARVASMEKQVKDLEKEMKALKTSGLVRPEAMTVLDDPAPEDCAIHIRGSIRNLGQVVPRGFLTVALHGDVPKVPADQSGRLQLAQWLTSSENPLTARVLVNRVWMHLFGEALVRSVDNFGTTGEKPSHPELLDALAIEFMKDGWSMKRLVKRLMLTRSYQMASTSPKAGQGQAQDPENRLLWKQNRRRVDAEVLRDAILATSGALDPKVGGPNVQADAVDSNSGAAQNLEYSYVFTDVRRSVYTPAFRNKRLDIFEAFDFADINQSIAKRNTSTVAPQALYMLNHAFVIEQSRKAAERLLTSASAGDTDEDLIRRLYLQALGRTPGDKELKLAAAFVQGTGAEGSTSERQSDTWALLVQTLFASVDFRYIN